ncbi:MAG: hypothetical protein ACI841_004373 [Planctomycetota bacterium]
MKISRDVSLFLANPGKDARRPLAALQENTPLIELQLSGHDAVLLRTIDLAESIAARSTQRVSVFHDKNSSIGIADLLTSSTLGTAT